MQALHQLRAWKATLTDRNAWMLERTVDEYNQALTWLSHDVGSGVLGFQIERDEFVTWSDGGTPYVTWDNFMSKLNGALGFAGARIAEAQGGSGPPPLPRESLRPVLRQLVDAQYRRPPEETGALTAVRAGNGLDILSSQDGGEPVASSTWEQLNQLRDGGYLRYHRGQDGRFSVQIEGPGMAAYRELVRLEEAGRPEGQPIERRAPMNNKVWVIEGHDRRAHDVIYALLTAVGLQPLEFDQAADLTGKPSPTIMEILRAAFHEGQAFVALLTPDEVAVPTEAFAEIDDPGPHPQPRPNVVLEAGMAFAYDPDRTVLVEMGRIREITDLGGVHTVKWKKDGYDARRRLLRKLKLAKCPVNDDGDHWVTAGGTYP